MINNTKA